MALPPKAILDQLNEAPVREIAGVVDAWGARVGRAGQQPWTVKIVCTHWKLVGSEVRETPISLHMQGTWEEVKAIRDSVAAQRVYRVRAHVVDGGGPASTDGWLVEVLGEDGTDEELNRVAEELQQPVTYEEGPFGVLRLNRKLKRFEADATWCSGPVRLMVSVGGDLDPQPAMAVARRLWGSQEEWNGKVYDCAVRDLLEKVWAQEGGEVITEEVFRQRLKLQAIVVESGGGFEFWFGDGNLFWGHAIKVYGNLSEGPISAGIEG